MIKESKETKNSSLLLTLISLVNTLVVEQQIENQKNKPQH